MKILMDQQRTMVLYFFHTTPNGKLSIVRGLVVIFKDQIDKAGNGMTIGWEWK